MSVWKRQWGEIIGYDDDGNPIRKKSAWVADYFDANGKRHIKTFKKQADAIAFEAKTRVEVKEGTHVADSETITVEEAADNWLKSCEERQLEVTTLAQYEQHVRLHIKPLIGHLLLTKLTVAKVRQFLDELHEKGRSAAMVKGVRTSLSSIIGEALEQGLIASNPVRNLSRTKGRKKDKRHEKPKLKVGVDIPFPEEVAQIGKKAKGLRAQVLVKLISTTGLRASEFRGLPWDALDLTKHQLHVRQRADAKNKIGGPKSKAGYRTVPLYPSVVKLLEEWAKKCPKKDDNLWLVFPDPDGKVAWHQSQLLPVWHQAQMDAGLTVQAKDDKGKPIKDEDGNVVMVPKYTGLHALRHFYASWCINRERDGGLGLDAKNVQERMGHSDISVTLNTYGHLFPRDHDKKELLRADKRLWG